MFESKFYNASKEIFPDTVTEEILNYYIHITGKYKVFLKSNDTDVFVFRKSNDTDVCVLLFMLLNNIKFSVNQMTQMCVFCYSCYGTMESFP